MKTTISSVLSKILVATTLIFSSMSFAQNPSGKMDEVSNFPTNGQGQFFSVKIVPGDKQTKFFVMGKKAAQLDFNKLSVQASYFLLNGEQKLITLKKDKDHFVTDAELGSSEIQIKIESDGTQTETIKLRLRRP